MNYYLGIDIGTSSTKAVCFDSKGHSIASKSYEYPLYNLKPGYIEQNPLDWLDATKKVIKEIVKLGYEIKGIGLSGQMHGLVILDKDDNPLRNSIIWCDNRAIDETEELIVNFDNEKMKKITGNYVVSSFTLAKLLWVKNNEPEIFKKIAKIMLPKDYIRYMLTKSFSTEYSDASGMQLVDIYNKKYSSEILDYIGINEIQLPKLLESKDISGYITKEMAEELKLSTDCFVVGGAGDQAASAIGNGIIEIGDASIVLGSSGVVFSPITKENLANNNLQVFMHAVPNTYHIMGVTNGCGLSYKWLKENLFKEKKYEELNELAKEALPTSKGLIYLPYLNGERTPHMDPYASGTFIGIHQNTEDKDIIRAVLEGVGYSLKDCFSLLPNIDYKVKISGGGAKGDLWREIIASILNFECIRIKQDEGGALGVAILAMVAGNEYSSIEEACQKIITNLDSTKPKIDWVNQYEKGYILYQKAYKALKDYFKIAYKN